VWRPRERSHFALPALRFDESGDRLGGKEPLRSPSTLASTSRRFFVSVSRALSAAGFLKTLQVLPARNHAFDADFVRMPVLPPECHPVLLIDPDAVTSRLIAL
jgi:hypothetical protein